MPFLSVNGQDFVTLATNNQLIFGASSPIFVAYPPETVASYPGKAS
jgi:hypothetical protein